MYHTNTGISRIVVAEGAVKGVIAEDGVFHEADIVVSGINPVLLFNHLLDEALVPEDIREHFKQYKCGSGSFRINVALNGEPEYHGNQVNHCMEAGIILGHSLEYMDAAWQSARKMGWSENPVVEMLIPSLVDQSLAPEGCHVASLFCQHFSPDLGAEWDDCRDRAVEDILARVEASFPGFGELVEGLQVLSPWDLEQEFSLVRGDIFHGRLSPEQLFSARPALGLAGYEMPVEGLYLCGSGAHPGGGVSGLPGHNAARKILRQH